MPSKSHTGQKVNSVRYESGRLLRMDDELVAALADAELAGFLRDIRRRPGPSARETGAPALREAQRRRVMAAPPGPSIPVIENIVIRPDGLGARLYRPANGPLPLVVFLHGGMWTIGDLDSHDRACRRLALGARSAVLSLDFRRAPESPWPAAVDDATDAVRWAVEHRSELGVTRAPAIAGDSSGGNLATLACLRLREEGGPLPTAQILIYPNTDLTLSQPCVREKGADWGLDPDAVAWGAEMWVPEPSMLADPRISPLYAPDLSGLPPALVVTAEHDPLRDEGDAYAARLAQAGVPVRHHREPKMIHGFLTLDAVSPAAAAAGDRLFERAGELLHRRTPECR
jgi:acetyl esterase